ncbi:hypothetical protein EDD37DRAFT_41189 [Exophiala viscosa]|uniref:uncharacterized protein n=1 Tax=Exophiala viscosa TaxID=2486360 RepID=UPI00219D5F9F|nr:hypothetical protein EDD37DRAFT_41189 [Exophiala viscosa]
MPPFFANAPHKKTGSSSIGGNPIPVRLRPVDKRRPEPVATSRRPRDEWDDDSITYSEGSAIVDPVLVSQAMGKSPQDVQMPRRPEKDFVGVNRPTEKPKKHTKVGRPVEEYGKDEYDHQTPYEDPPSYIPFLPVYEYCRLLQKRGATVRFSAATVRDAPLSYLDGPRPSISEHLNSEDHRPGAQEVQAINDALTVVLNCGADVEFRSLLPEQQHQQFRCRTCPKTFNSQGEDQQHRETGRCVCDHCGQKNFGCRGLYEAHMRDHERLVQQRMNNTNYTQPEMRRARGEY